MATYRRGLVWLLTLWLIGAPALSAAEDRRATACRLSVMTFNAQFLWDGVAPEEGTASFPWRGSPTEAQEHMRRVAEVIIRSNPDVVNLVEVENLEALTLFNTTFLAGRGYRPYLVQGTDTSTGQDVALLTRVDPENDAIERENRQGEAGTVRKSVSKNYVARLVVDNTRIALIGVHFLAFPLNESRRLQREAQADAIRRRAVELQTAGFQVIVLGDLNDFDGDTPSRDHRDSAPVTNVLRNLKAMNPAVPTDDLVNAARSFPRRSGLPRIMMRTATARLTPRTS